MDEQTIENRIKEFTWYSPVDFGNGVVASGNFLMDEFNESIHFGVGKWKYILERNIPDLQGKRVLDIGCNNGTSCIHIARMGAREVFGIDSDATWSNWKAQAEFVKEAMEWRCNTSYPITFLDCDMAGIPELDLGRFDVVTGLCCIYYMEEDKIVSLLKYFYDHIDFLLLQCNTNKRDQIPEVHRRAKPKYLGRLLKHVGFKYIAYDEPLLYTRPVVTASNRPFKKKPKMGKIDLLRDLIRRKI